MCQLIKLPINQVANLMKVCKVFGTISATLKFFMLLIVVGTLRVPSLQTKTVTITLHTRNSIGYRTICDVMCVMLYLIYVDDSRNRKQVC